MSLHVWFALKVLLFLDMHAEILINEVYDLGFFFFTKYLVLRDRSWGGWVGIQKKTNWTWVDNCCS